MTTEERLLSIVNPGRLNHLATVLQATRSVDARGNWIEKWEPVGTVHCYIEQHSTQVYQTNGENHMIRKTLIATRYRPDAEGCRYVVDGKTYIPTGAHIDACLKHRVTFAECVEEVDPYEAE